MTAYPPTPKFRITQPFAKPGKYASTDDSHGRAGHHTGVDYGRLLSWVTMLGRRVESCTPGTVVISEHNSWAGNMVGVYYAADNVTITYWHLLDRAVSRGDTVRRGQQIGRVGSSGNSTGPHIHVQANRGSGFDYHGHIDPAPWVALTTEEAPVASGLCPFAKKKLIKPGSNDPAIVPRVAILHVDAGNAFSLFDFFKFRSGGIESHFHIRNDGVIEQYRSVLWQADANLHANDFGVSIETQGLEHGTWNAKQLASIKRLLLWLNEAHGIPLRECDGPFGSGVGHHTMWGAPSAWTPVAKSCPGPNRKAQFRDDIVPWMNGNPTAPRPTTEDDMPYTDWPEKDRKALINDIALELRRRPLYGDKDRSEADVLREMDNTLDKLRAFMREWRAEGK